MKSAVTFLILDKKSSIFFSSQGLVEISSKMRSFVDILILDHPIPYLLRGTSINLPGFKGNPIVKITIGFPLKPGKLIEVPRSI